MSGGHATTAGVQYQCEVGAWLAAHILCAQPISEIGSEIPASLQMETVSPVDDIVVRTREGSTWFINVKTEVSLSTLAKSQLSSVVDQFVRQWLEGSASGADGFQPIDPRRDRLVLAVKPNRSGTLVNGLTPVIRRLADVLPDSPPAFTQGEQEAFKAFEAQVSYHWRRQKGTAPSQTDLLRLMSCVRLIEFDLGGPARAALSSMLSSVVDSDKSSAAIDSLVQACMSFAKNRSSGDEETLRVVLAEKQLGLKQRPDFQQDIVALQSSTSRALEDMARYASVRIRASGESIELARFCTEAITRAANRGSSFLVIGEPGSGKSGALHAAAAKLAAAGRSVLMIQVDQLRGTSLEEMRHELSLKHPLLDVLAEWKPSGGGILMIDALDASRGTGAEPAVRKLISEIRSRAPHWVVVASIRKFDLRYGSQYHRLFDGEPVDEDFSDKEFAHVCHINIPQLSAAEIAEVRGRWPALDRIASASGYRFSALLQSPFNLYLLGRILEREATGANTAQTQLDLLAQFWKQRVEGADFEDAQASEFVLDGLLRSMLEQRRLAAMNSDVPQTHLAALKRLLSDGVLYQPHGTRLLSFVHHVLFDFALAKLIFLRDEARVIDDELVKATDDMLLVAPAIVLALRTVWERDSSRNAFWSVSVGIAEDDRIGSFVRSLPSRVAAEAVQGSSDTAPLIQALRNARQNSTASFLARHLLAVLLAGIVRDVPRLGSPNDPWCAIVDQMASASLKTLQWPINAVLSTWSAGPLTNDQRAALGAAARRLFALQLNDEAAYNQGSVRAAIQTVVRAFASAPEESERLIRCLLDPLRIQAKGHGELFWLVTDFKTLADANAQLAADFMVAAFSAPLPSSDDVTSIGDSRILSLTSNKKQDFEGILYQLEEKLPWFMNHSPGIAARAFRELLIAQVAAEDLGKGETLTGVADLGGRRVSFREDRSFVWWSARTQYYDRKAKLLQQFCKTLEAASNSVFDTFVEVAVGGVVPAGLIAALLRAASNREYPGDVIELLLSPDVLGMLDTSYDAGQLLARHYICLDREQQIALQHAIASLGDERRKTILVGCIPTDQPLFEAELAQIREAQGDTAPPPNVPHFSMSSEWRPSDDDWWLKGQGVDTEAAINKKLLSGAESLAVKNLPADDSTALDTLGLHWQSALTIVDEVSSAPDLHKTVRSKVMNSIAELVQTICDRAKDEGDLQKFPRLREVLGLCLSDDLDPLPVRSESREEQFAQSASWGSPAPRIPAAAALMSYVRALGRAPDFDRDQVLRLARDPAVEVRHTILARANLTCVAVPELSSELARIAFQEERNEGVLSFFLGAFNNYIGQNLSWAPAELLSLDSRIAESNESSRHDLRSSLVLLILRLWLAWGVPEAGERLRSWVDSPLDHIHRVDALLSHLRGVVVHGEVENANEQENELRKKGLELYSRLVAALAEAHHDLLGRASASEDVRQPLTDATRLLDSAAHHLYYGSGAYDLRKDHQGTSVNSGASERRRFIQEYLPTLKRLARIPYPSVTHPILEIIEALVADGPEEMLELLLETVREGGRSGGYQFESLGADLVVQVARRFLADYSGLVASRAEYRLGLVEILNLFAETGWGEARKLVYELPEMLR